MKEISVREFARREQCSDTAVHQAIRTGRLTRLKNGRMDEALVGTPWRRANWQPATDPVPAELARVAEAIAPYSMSEALRIKENLQVKLKQLEWDRESGRVAPIDATAAAVAAEYSLVRNGLLSLPARIAPTLAFLNTAELVRASLEQAVVQLLENLTLDTTLESRRGGRGVTP